MIIKLDAVASEVPLLLSRSAMKTAQMKLNFERSGSGLRLNDDFDVKL